MTDGPDRQPDPVGRRGVPARSGARGRPGWRAIGTFLLRRVPFTSAVVLVMIVAAVLSRALWTGIESLPIYRHVAFGLPAFTDGRWYTLAFGAFFALIPVYYVFVAGGFALLVGFSECRLGTGRTVVVTVGGHLVGVLGAAAVLAAGRSVHWPWAVRIGGMTDVGFSAGMLAVVCVAGVTVAAPWGLRIRLAAASYAGLSLLYIGLMADLEHSIAVLAGWSLARVLAGPHAVRQDPPTVTEWRLLGAIGLAVGGVLPAAVRLFPGDGPTGTAEHDSAAPLIWHCVLGVVALATAVGWWRGRRWALPAGLAVAGAYVLVAAVVAVLTGPATLPHWLRVDAPTVYADAVVGIGLAVLLILGRRAVGDDRTGRATGPIGAPAAWGRIAADGAGSQK
jgi:hypothetical protein